MNEREEKDDCEVPQRVHLVRWRKRMRIAARSIRTDRQGQCETESGRMKGNDHGEWDWHKPGVSHGKPDAGNSHVRFEEGAGVPYGGASLYSTKPCQRGRAGTRVPTVSGKTGRVTRPA